MSRVKPAKPLVKSVQRWPVARDAILFVTGILILVHETFLTNLDRPYLLVAGLACVGSPLAIRADEYLKGR